MNPVPISLLLLGLSDVGKTHYGAQVLRRLNAAHGAFELISGDNLKPFRTALDKISEGLSAPHTPRGEYTESRWTLRRRSDAHTMDLLWPDYGGEQIRGMIDTKKLPATWRAKLINSCGWLLMVRPSQVPLPEDILTRAVSLPSVDDTENTALTPQSKLIELLQMMTYKRQAYLEHYCAPPPLAVLLSCYDELETDKSPGDYCRDELPMLNEYLQSNWPDNTLRIFAVSPLGQALSAKQPNKVYAASGPETKGFVIDKDGSSTDDLLAPVAWLLSVSHTR